MGDIQGLTYLANTCSSLKNNLIYAYI